MQRCGKYSYSEIEYDNKNRLHNIVSLINSYHASNRKMLQYPWKIFLLNYFHKWLCNIFHGKNFHLFEKFSCCELIDFRYAIRYHNYITTTHTLIIHRIFALLTLRIFLLDLKRNFFEILKPKFVQSGKCLHTIFQIDNIFFVVKFHFHWAIVNR